MNKDQLVIGGNLVTYYRFGSGPKTLIFLHGWRSEALAWNQIIQMILSEDLTIYAIDLPGFGQSPLPKSDFSIAEYADLIGDFITNLKLAKVTLIGHSFGGRISIKLSTTKPELISKLVLVDSAGLRNNINRNKLLGIGAKIVKPAFKLKLMAPIRKSIYKIIGSEDYIETPELQKIYLKTIGEDLRNHLAEIEQPTLILWGKNDKSTPVRDAEIMNQEIKNSKKVLIENAGHFSFIDQPEKFSDELKKFIRE